MIETRIPEIDLETLVKHVREELRRLHETPPEGDASGPKADPAESPPVETQVFSTACPTTEVSSPALSDDLPQTPPGAVVDFRDLDAHWAGRFVDLAYRTVLGRAPDPEGLAYRLEALCTGRLTKAEVVARLRWSPEGRTHGVRIQGLLPALARAALRKIPIFGRILRHLDALTHRTTRQLEEFSAQMQSFCARQNTIVQTQSVVTAHLQDVVHPRLEALQNALETQSALTAQLQDVVHPRLEALKNAVDALRAELLPPVESLQRNLQDLLSKDPIGHLQNHARAIAQVREALADHQRRLASWAERWSAPHGALSVTEATPRTPADSAQATPDETPEDTALPLQARARDVQERLFDAFYTSLEQAFRGDSKDIENRLRFYLPYLQKLPLDLAPLPVVDAGCGRGEWLELLRAEGYEALGVDTNRLMVARCREKGLNAVEADAIRLLKELPPGGTGAVTAFQLIEHLELEDLIRFVDAAYECLVPGGMLLCETPNPENLIVSSYSFYLDPTHRRPIPPPVAVFLLESAGFCDVAIVRPPRVRPPESQEMHGIPPLLQKLLFAEEDYAVIGYKPPCRHAL